jgi:ribonuclease-3
MSRPRLHETLERVFGSRDFLPDLLQHEDFRAFAAAHGLAVPLPELSLAFTHKSFSHEFQVSHQEQLEFLGDSVLQLILTEELFRRFPTYKEGQLSKLRSAIVNGASLATIARGLGLGALLIVGKGEYQKRLFEQETVLADTFEALLAQVYRFHGLAFARALFLLWLERFIPAAFDANFLTNFDAKSTLQERVLARYKKLPRYSAEARGDAFEVVLWINDAEIGRGVFPSKKLGEKELADAALKKGII